MPTNESPIDLYLETPSWVQDNQPIQITVHSTRSSFSGQVLLQPNSPSLLFSITPVVGETIDLVITNEGNAPTPLSALTIQQTNDDGSSNISPLPEEPPLLPSDTTVNTNADSGCIQASSVQLYPLLIFMLLYSIYHCIHKKRRLFNHSQ